MTVRDRRVLLLFHLRAGRARAREIAVAEALQLLADLSPEAPPGGPLSDRGGLFWITLPAESIEAAARRLLHLGYTEAVDLLEPRTDAGKGIREKAGKTVPRSSRHAARRKGHDVAGPDMIPWKGRWFQPIRVAEEDPAAARERDPDRRSFLLETDSGAVVATRGYRGDGTDTGRRALPVCDARMLVNLSLPSYDSVDPFSTGVTVPFLLDPFAGAGGIVLEAVARGCRVASVDLEPRLRFGLAGFGALHAVGDARRLPFRSGVFDAAATEPPYHAPARGAVLEALGEMERVIRPGGRTALLCAGHQADGLRDRAVRLGLDPLLDAPIDRKGSDVRLLLYRKAARPPFPAR